MNRRDNIAHVQNMKQSPSLLNITSSTLNNLSKRNLVMCLIDSMLASFLLKLGIGYPRNQFLQAMGSRLFQPIKSRNIAWRSSEDNACKWSAYWSRSLNHPILSSSCLQQERALKKHYPMPTTPG